MSGIGGLEDSGSIYVESWFCLFVVHSLQFLEVFAIIIPSRLGGLFRCNLTDYVIADLSVESYGTACLPGTAGVGSGWVVCPPHAGVHCTFIHA